MKICSHPGCDRESHNRGRFCGGHTSRFYKGTDMDAPFLQKCKNDGPCAIEGCKEKPRAKNLCKSHYRLTLVSDQECAWPLCANMSSRTKNFCDSCCNRLRNHNLPHDSDRLKELLADYYCAACGSQDRLHIDHDHNCCGGKRAGSCGSCIRGLLCFDCNLALGLLRDSPERLRSLAQYIEDRIGAYHE